jgi:uncharacterized membrane protein
MVVLLRPTSAHSVTWPQLITTGGIIFPLFLNRVLEEVGFASMVRYCALFVGILLAFSCFFVTARLPKKPWNAEMNWIDLTLFKDSAFASYTLGAFLVMLVTISPLEWSENLTCL